MWQQLGKAAGAKQAAVVSKTAERFQPWVRDVYEALREETDLSIYFLRLPLSFEGFTVSLPWLFLIRTLKNTQSAHVSLGLAQVVKTWLIPQIFADRAMEMLKALAAKPDDLNFIPGIHTRKGKNWPAICPLTSTQFVHSFPWTATLLSINK